MGSVAAANHVIIRARPTAVLGWKRLVSDVIARVISIRHVRRLIISLLCALKRVGRRVQHATSVPLTVYIHARGAWKGSAVL